MKDEAMEEYNFDIEEELKQLEKERQEAEEKADAYQGAFKDGVDGSSEDSNGKGQDKKQDN